MCVHKHIITRNTRSLCPSSPLSEAHGDFAIVPRLISFYQYPNRKSTMIWEQIPNCLWLHVQVTEHFVTIQTGVRDDGAESSFFGHFRGLQTDEPHQWNRWRIEHIFDLQNRSIKHQIRSEIHDWAYREHYNSSRIWTIKEIFKCFWRLISTSC